MKKIHSAFILINCNSIPPNREENEHSDGAIIFKMGEQYD
jgi:hypothetical protein